MLYNIYNICIKVMYQERATNIFVFYGIFPRLQTACTQMPTQASPAIETFANPAAGRDYVIRMTVPEFTCLCPKTGQPDFATLEIEYIPDELCVELKSLKLYIWSYRDQGTFHEAVTNKILDDLVICLKPRFMRITAKFNVRGGIYTNVVVEHRGQDWQGTDPVRLP